MQFFDASLKVLEMQWQYMETNKEQLERDKFGPLAWGMLVFAKLEDLTGRIGSIGTLARTTRH